MFNSKTCHEIGICQRTTPQCHRVCHMAKPDLNGPPIGYEAAPASNVCQLRYDQALQRAADCLPQDEPVTNTQRAASAFVMFGGGLALLAIVVLVGYSFYNPDSWIHRLGRAVMGI